MDTHKIRTNKEFLQNFPFKNNPLERYKDFINQILAIYQKHYGYIDKALLPDNDKKLLLQLFNYHINNVGNPDGNCQYGLSTRGFELKLLNLYFNFLNIKPYGEKYGKVNTQFYNHTNNPDPDFSFGYFTLGAKEAALWAFKAAKTKFKSMNMAAPVLVPYNKLPIRVLDAAFLLDLKKEEPENVKNAIMHKNKTAIMVVYLKQDIEENELIEIRQSITNTKHNCGKNCFIHITADSIVDILRLSDGYNLLIKDSPRFYAYPAQPYPSDFSSSGNFYVDTISISNTPSNCSSFQSGILVTTTKNQKFFNSATVAYIGAEDSTVVGSSNGDFLLLDYYFNQRFPVSTLHLLKGKDPKQLKTYMEQQQLSESERRVYVNLILYLNEIKPMSIGYPINQNWDDEELDALFELLIKEKLIYNTELKDSFVDLNLSESINPKTNKPYVEEFENEILDFYKKEVFFPYTANEFEGYITTGGTEGNYTGLYLASQLYGSDAILFLTSETHYSVSKGASIFGIAYQLVNTTNEESGNMDCADLKYKIKRHIQQNPNAKIIVNANIATTVKGSIDSIKRIKKAIVNCQIAKNDYWIHCDGALQGNLFPFLPEQQAKNIVPFILNPKDPDYVAIDSIAVSGHKFIGAPFPCGITLFRKSAYDAYEKNIRSEIHDAIKSSSDLYSMNEVTSYLNQNSIISGSKNYYMTVVIWKRIMQLGRDGFEKLVNQCEQVTQYAMQQLISNMPNTGVKPFRNPMCNIITLTPPPSQYVRNKYNLPVDKSSHIDVMPHVTTKLIDNLILDMIEHPIDINPKS